MKVNEFITKMKTEFGDLIFNCALHQILLDGLNDLDFDMDKAIAENTQRHTNAEKNGAFLMTTLEFDIAWCKCMKATIDWIQANGKSYIADNFIKLVKKSL